MTSIDVNWARAIHLCFRLGYPAVGIGGALEQHSDRPIGPGPGAQPDPGPNEYERSMAVQLRGLTKRFESLEAVAGLDLDVPRGRFFGLVGPNGAGKTTTLAMVTGLLRPDAGHARVDGVDVWAEPLVARARMGVLPEGLRLFERLSGPELLQFTGRLRGMDPAEVDQRAGELLSVLGLAEAGAQLVVDYSTGMRKKVALAAALLHNPAVLFLDEPFEAVDPVSARTIREVLRAFAGRGGTVVFSSHVMDLVERTCDDVAVMARGRVLAAGPVDEVRGGRTLEETFVDLVGGVREAGPGLDWLGSS
jgi:ABC-2 type transport system ATP-binding protein